MEMSGPLETGLQTFTKKGRPTTSCTECSRRKQKCDRKKPCNHCSARNVVDRCVYTRPLSLRSGESSVILDVRESEMHHIQNGEPVQMLPDWTNHIQRSSQLGYSSVAGSNSFVELGRIFNEGNEFESMHAAYNRHPLPPSQLCPEALSLISRLPPRQITDEIIEAFFLDVNWHYFIVEKFYFNDLFSRWYNAETSPVTYLSSDGLERELRYFPTLLFQIVALSLQFLRPDAAAWRFFGGEANLSQKYSDMGVELLDLLGRQDTALTAVQANLLRASWLKNLGRGIDAWRSLGEAIRLSQELGLHRQQCFHQPSSDNVENSLDSFWYNEYKKRVWINLYTWDSLMALVLGRPMMINNCDCDTQLPIDCDIPELPSRTVPMTLSANPDKHRPTSLSASLVRYCISAKVHLIRELKLDTPYPVDYSMVGTLHEQVLTILKGIKPALRHQDPDTSCDSQYHYLPQQREELLTVVYTFLMALHRPHISSHAQSRRAVLQAAIVVLDSQQRLFELTELHHYMLCHLSFYTVDAAILLSVVTSLYPQQSSEDTSDIYRALQQSIARLSMIAPVNPTAKSGLDVIKRCYQRLQEPRRSLSAAEVIPAHLPSTVGQLQDTSEAPGDEQGSHAEYLQYESYPFPVELPQNFSTTHGVAPTHYFDQSYWLRQVNSIYSTAAHVSDL
ncbi:fungal-specific transcription factor domain-containing protein [Aspergillus caelatus]|uniref:Fungal-specific transcription factor domain-containing protein n=1 Tax=Aspergillus caelatus TaxID=61420 RepID=A0A5N6ZZ23_9EURO|nr:fungal-specific transcription factor domain-containing protein [Aspergillus caelatus]KAE8362189.1 fungal-specific transcription factor domain-containing protein [Aspergillus caelatus]